MTDRDLDAAWYVGQPGFEERYNQWSQYAFEERYNQWSQYAFEERYNQWSQYAFDTTEKAVVGKRSREWIAVGPTELRCVQTMAYCLLELGEGRWPK